MDLIGKRFKVGVADSYCTYEVTEQATATMDNVPQDRVPMVYIEKVRVHEYDDTAFFGENAWIEEAHVAAVIAQEERWSAAFRH